jgi:hypothetical protein
MSSKKRLNVKIERNWVLIQGLELMFHNTIPILVFVVETTVHRNLANVVLEIFICIANTFC